MAVYRAPQTCPFCGHEVHFKYNKLTDFQMESGWCGDQGDYTEHSKVCKSLQRENKLNKVLGVTQSQSIIDSMEFNERMDKFHNSPEFLDMIDKLNKKN